MHAFQRSLIFLAGTAVLVAGCGPSPVTPAAEQKPVTLTLQIRYPADSARAKVIQTMLDSFQQKNSKITVRLTGANYAPDKLSALASSPEAPDLMQVPDEAIADFADKGLFSDLTDRVKDLQGTYYDRVWELAQSGGRTWALPWFGHTLQLIYSRSAFKAAGLDPAKPPTNWDELYRTAQTLTRGQQYGFGLVGKQHPDLAAQWDMFLWQAGGDLVKRQGDKWRVAVNGVQGLRALQFYLRLKGVAEPQMATASAAETATLFANKRVAMHYLGPWSVADASKAAPDADVYAAPLPRDSRPATVYATENLVIFKNNKHPDESLKLMRFLAGPEAARLLMAGDGGRNSFAVPVIKSMESDPFFQKDHPELKAFLQGFSYAYKIFPIKGWARVHNEVMQLHLNKAVLGQETPENALAAMEKEGNAILDQIYK